MSELPPNHSSFLKRLFKKTPYEGTLHPELNQEENIIFDYYLDFAENHPDIFLVLSLTGEVLSRNTNSINELLGYSAKRKIDYSNYLSADNYSILQKTFHKSIKGVTKQRDIIVSHKNGEQLFLKVTFVPIKAKKNPIEGVFLIIEDTTPQRELEKLYKLKANHLDNAQQIANIGSWEYIVDKNIVNCSDTFYSIYGIQSDEAISLDTVYSYIHNEDIKKVSSLVEKAIDEGGNYETTFRIDRSLTGELRYLKVYMEVDTETDRMTRLIGVVKDITDHKLLEQNLLETNEHFRHIFDHLSVGIWMSESVHGHFTYISKGLSDIFQIPIDRLYKEPECWKNIILPMYKEKLFEKYNLLEQGKSMNHIYRINTEDGTTKWVYEQTIPKVDANGNVTHLFGMVMDVSAEVGVQKKLEFLAKNDELTAIPNQRSLYEKLDELIGDHTVQTFALIYIDLDDFSWITDYLGYQISDIVLQKIAQKLVHLLPKEGYLANVHSDRFIFVVPNYTNKDKIEQLAKIIIKRIGEKLVVQDYEIYVTASIGISFYPENGKDKLAILENAHSAVYHAKSLGKNNYQLYSFNRDIDSHKKYMLEKDLRHAIENKELEIYYQPQVNPRNGVIEGVEALLRWHHKDWGVVSPSDFISLAEQKHLIHEIGAWIIEEVCLHLKKWKEKEYKLIPVAVNVSPIQFLKTDLVTTVEDNLRKNDIPADYLQLEITESTFLKNELQVKSMIKALNKLGVRIALDDFGTGYSSFRYLHEFDISTLKIDQLFLRNLTAEDHKNMAIVSSLLHLGKELDIQIIAEGVEEYEQMEILRQKECDLIQGFLYSKPVHRKKFEQMLQTGYLYPKKKKISRKPAKERRKYYRFEFASSLLAEMRITEVNKRKVNVGSANILIGNISLGGVKILSSLKLPVGSNLKLKFKFYLMEESFDVNGSLVWINEERPEIFTYGVAFKISNFERDTLAPLINKMTVLEKQNKDIPDTEFINENPYAFLRKDLE